MIKKGIILMAVLAFASLAFAKTSFRTKRLAAMAQAAQLELRVDSAGVLVANEEAYRHRSLRILTDSRGEVTHVGYRLFHDTVVEDSLDHYFFLTFLERYFLELDMQLDGRRASERMALDKVQCTDGKLEMRHRVTASCPYSLELFDRRRYRIAWTLGADRFELTVPADAQLLLGANAVELESIFERWVPKVQSMAYEEKEQPFPHSFLSSYIRNDLYYRDSKEGRSLIFSPRNPVISVKNILLTGVFPGPLPMEVTFDRYGYVTSQLSFTLQQFLTCCWKEGFQLYVGIKEVKPEQISASLFALNNELGCSHLLSVEFPTGLLAGKEGRLKARLYVYIPLQNVTESFFKHDAQEASSKKGEVNGNDSLNHLESIMK